MRKNFREKIFTKKKLKNFRENFRAKRFSSNFSFFAEFREIFHEKIF
jgi:hypothetical protein